MPDATPKTTLSAFSRTSDPKNLYSSSGSLGAVGVGLSGGSVSSSLSKTGGSYNYALIIQVPVPELKFNLNISPSWVLAQVGLPKLPAALASLLKTAEEDFNKIQAVFIKLITAVPELTVTIIVKVGPIPVLNVQLVAKKVPVVVPLPDFQLDLPSIALAAGIDLSSVLALVPLPPPVTIVVPVPVPVINFPNVTITGGKITAVGGITTGGGGGAAVSGGAALNTGGVAVAPPPVSNPIRLPNI